MARRRTTLNNQDPHFRRSPFAGAMKAARSTSRLGVAAVTASILTACGGATGVGDADRTEPGGVSQDLTKKVAADPSLVSLVPDVVKSRGSLIMVTDAEYAPNEFVDADGKTLIGWDVELGTAIARKLGLQPQWINGRFDGIIPGLQAGKFDLGISSFSVTAEREKVVDFVTYYRAPGTAMLVKKGNPKGLAFDGDKACGIRLSASQGSIQVDEIKKYSAACKAHGKPGVPGDGQVYVAQNDAVLALQSDRTDAVLSDTPVAAYSAKQANDAFEIAAYNHQDSAYGIALAKNGLAKAVQGAMRSLIADGTYRKLLDKWGQSGGAITDPTINGMKS
ncbi:ABC transporter substrate-binding protein [Nonomuraea sp. NPDC026600]|uniref:ABC transporter substrate-binding protein n=1 Tax=Nonomuraea sp. NPDC026600 TaxID=3155363 RepID=UPI0033F77D24